MKWVFGFGLKLAFKGMCDIKELTLSQFVWQIWKKVEERMLQNLKNGRKRAKIEWRENIAFLFPWIWVQFNWYIFLKKDQ